MAREGGGGGFAVSLEMSGEEGGPLQLGTGIELVDGAAQRRFRLDREPISSPRAFADHLRIVWLTPAMDGLFTGPAGERRRFLDRLVLAVDSEHGARVNALGARPAQPQPPAGGGGAAKKSGSTPPNAKSPNWRWPWPLRGARRSSASPP